MKIPSDNEMEGLGIPRDTWLPPFGNLPDEPHVVKNRRSGILLRGIIQALPEDLAASIQTVKEEIEGFNTSLELNPEGEMAPRMKILKEAHERVLAWLESKQDVK